MDRVGTFVIMYAYPVDCNNNNDNRQASEASEFSCHQFLCQHRENPNELNFGPIKAGYPWGRCEDLKFSLPCRSTTHSRL